MSRRGTEVASLCTPEQAQILSERIEGSVQMYDFDSTELAEDVARLLLLGVPALEIIVLGSDVAPWPFAVGQKLAAQLRREAVAQ